MPEKGFWKKLHIFFVNQTSVQKSHNGFIFWTNLNPFLTPNLAKASFCAECWAFFMLPKKEKLNFLNHEGHEEHEEIRNNIKNLHALHGNYFNQICKLSNEGC